MTTDIAQGLVDVNVRHGSAVTADGAEYPEPEKMRWMAEEYMSAMMAMDRDGVPRKDAEGQSYSIYGRACLIGNKKPLP